MEKKSQRLHLSLTSAALSNNDAVNVMLCTHCGSLADSVTETHLDKVINHCLYLKGASAVIAKTAQFSRFIL